MKMIHNLKHNWSILYCINVSIVFILGVWWKTTVNTIYADYIINNHWFMVHVNSQKSW